MLFYFKCLMQNLFKTIITGDLSGELDPEVHGKSENAAALFYSQIPGKIKESRLLQKTFKNSWPMR